MPDGSMERFLQGEKHAPARLQARLYPIFI
jgi:hypothetical protein